MAGKSKKISDFQKALLSNTKVIGKGQDENNDLMIDHEYMIQLDKKIYKQIKILANYQKQDINELVAEALNHYLGLKKRKLEKAMLELTKDEDDMNKS
jgi:predicted HicB family RNase H-like nuclease